MGKYLQDYLDRGLFHIDGKDDRVGFLENASAALVEKIKADKPAIVKHTLLLLGPTVASDDEVLDGVEKLIKDNGFKTIRSIYPTRSLPMIRAVVLDALSEVINDDDSTAANLVWLTGCDLLRFIDDEKQRDLLLAFFYEARAIVEEMARQEWMISSGTSKKSSSKIEFPKKVSLSNVSIDVTALTNAFAAAAGPNLDSQQPGEIVTWNPHWTNQPQHWSWQFAKIAGQQVAKVLNSASAKQSGELTKIIESLQEAVEVAVSQNQEMLKIAASSQQQAAQSGERRSQLLWWKEALFSSTFLVGYREMSKFQACLALAKDLSDLVGTVTPLSMDYFLREGVSQVISSEMQNSSIQVFCESMSSKEHQTWLDKLFPSASLAPKKLFAEFAKELISGATKIGECESFTGISLTAETSLLDFAVWHFHYLQLQKNLASK
jgi:hypothetical protein